MSEPARPGALTRILPALVLASGLGYGVQLLAPFLIDAASYVEFSAFWSSLFLGVAALSGVQNEVSRSSRLDGTTEAIFPLRRYALAVGSGAVVGGGVAGGVLGVALDSSETVMLVAAMSMGLGSFVILAALTGTLYGGRRWTTAAIAIVADPGLRAAGFLVVAVALCAFNGANASLAVLLFATVVPFAGAVALVWWSGARRAVRSVFVDLTWVELLRNSFHTVTAATALGFVASGMPLVIAIVGQGEEPSLVAGVILVVVLLRAPLVSPMIALQSYLVVSFRDAPSTALRRAIALTAILLVASSVMAVIVPLAVPLVAGILGPDYTLPAAWVLVGSVFAAGLVGVQLIAGAAVLARGRYRLYALGWLTTALGVIVVAFIPLPFELGLLVLLVVPACAGLAVHVLGLAWSGSRPARTV